MVIGREELAELGIKVLAGEDVQRRLVIVPESRHEISVGAERVRLTQRKAQGGARPAGKTRATRLVDVASLTNATCSLSSTNGNTEPHAYSTRVTCVKYVTNEISTAR